MRLQDPGLLRFQCYMDGQWTGGNAPTDDVIDPATGETLGGVPNLGAEETRQAIAAAQAAFLLWREKTGKERGALLRRWYDLQMEHTEDLAVILTHEEGKPLEEARGEVVYSAGFCEFYAEEAKRVYGDTIPAPRPHRRAVVISQPVGVVAAITPWNFPLAMITRKVAPALAAGCTVVCKPAPQTPLSAFALAELAHRAGIPPGVINVVTGDAVAVGGELSSNPRVRKLTFTGSTPVGKLLMEQCAGTMKKVSLELGGNAPFLVFNDADLDAAVAGALASRFRNSGQTCVCANRFIVQSGVYDDFVSRFSAGASQLKVGNGFDAGVQQGPLIDAAGLEKVEELVADAVDRGAQVTAGGARHELGGTFYQPTVLADTPAAARLAREEAFGPVAPVFRFDADEEGIAMANDTVYGLASYFYSRDLGRCWRVAEALEAGMVGINEGIISSETVPFGGWKESGLGREGGKWGIREFLEEKYMLMGGLEGP